MRHFIISYKKRPLGESGESCKSDYDLSKACVDCGTGAKLKGNLRVKGFSNIKKDFFETLDGDYIISTRLYSLIKKDFNDFNLLQVIDSKNNPLDFYHFANNVTLPRFKKDSTGFVIDRQCQTCKRNGYFTHAEIGNLEKNIPTVIHPYIFKYDKADFEKYKSELILNTWECFGLSNKIAKGKYVIRYARPLTIVSEKIKDIFDSEKLNDIEYELIEIE
jgi:hypothetical protein